MSHATEDILITSLLVKHFRDYFTSADTWNKIS